MLMLIFFFAVGVVDVVAAVAFVLAAIAPFYFQKTPPTHPYPTLIYPPLLLPPSPFPSLSLSRYTTPPPPSCDTLKR